MLSKVVCKFDVLGHDSHILDMGDKVVIIEEDDVVVLKFLLQCLSYGCSTGMDLLQVLKQMVIFQT